MIQDHSWSCSKHPQQKITFICVGNVWHFQPLCNNCIPEHTKNHPKNIKVQLQNISEVFPKATQLKKKVSHIFEQRMGKCNILKNIQESQWTYIKSINLKRQTAIGEVNIFFDNLIMEVKKGRAEQQQTQRQNLNKIGEVIQEKIAFFKRQEYLDIENFCNEIKKYYFKDNLQIYVEQVDQIIQQYQQKIIKFDPFTWNKQLNIKLGNLLKESYKSQDAKDKKNIKEKQDIKKQTKKKEVLKKRCPNCKQEMEYLTQWKKHLVCRNCGNKQRNYLKKI